METADVEQPEFHHIIVNLTDTADNTCCSRIGISLDTGIKVIAVIECIMGCLLLCFLFSTSQLDDYSSWKLLFQLWALLDIVSSIFGFVGAFHRNSGLLMLFNVIYAITTIAAISMDCIIFYLVCENILSNILLISSLMTTYLLVHSTLQIYCCCMIRKFTKSIKNNADNGPW